MSDRIAFQLFNHMVQDFRSSLGDEHFAESALKALQKSVKEFRAYQFPELGEVSPYRFKAWWQLSNFLKRYRFADDSYDDVELKERTLEKFFDFQTHLATRPALSHRSFLVCQEARRIAKRILRLPYDTEPYRHFGRRATVCCPLQKAYLDNKLGQCTNFTSPTPLRKELHEFFSLTPFGKDVRRILRKSRKKRHIEHFYKEVDYLNLTLVPKSWKTLRPITPLSEFGLYWSYGIGGYITECLRLRGIDLSREIDISRQQTRHKKWAKEFSVTRSHVTADLSSASDSLTSDLLNRVLPRFLFRDLQKTFCRQLSVDGKRFYTGSCLPMGNGATFPVETLVFYCLVKAVGNLLKVKGTFSVYGDDLIYPRRIHSYVMQIFADLGIKVNAEKTFSHSHFRESCGGDYYHGVDVRPALFPEDRFDVSSSKSSRQALYNVWNILKERWTRYELPRTFYFLEKEIAIRSRGRVYFVPKSFPSTSGFRVRSMPKIPWYIENSNKVLFKNGCRWFRFKCLLNESPPKRRLIHEEFYMWSNLKPHIDPVEDVHIRQWKHLISLALREIKGPPIFARKRLVGDEVCLYEAEHASGTASVRQVQLSNWT